MNAERSVSTEQPISVDQALEAFFDHWLPELDEKFFSEQLQILLYRNGLQIVSRV